MENQKKHFPVYAVEIIGILAKINSSICFLSSEKVAKPDVFHKLPDYMSRCTE
jgi:hypothetical protein